MKRWTVSAFVTASVCLASMLVTGCAQHDLWQTHLRQGQEALKANRLSDAERFMDLAFTEAQATPSDPARLIRTLVTMGAIYRTQGRMDKAVEVYRQALSHIEKIGGSDSAEYALTLNLLSGSLFDEGKYEEAQQCALRALQLQERIAGKNSSTVAVIANNLGQIKQKLGDDTGAEDYFLRAIAVYESAGGKLQAGLVNTYNNLALFYKKERRLEEARDMALRALEVQRENKDSPGNIAETLNTLGIIEKGGYNYGESETYYQRAMDLLKNASSDDDRELLCDVLDNYADLLSLQGELERAEPIYKNAIRTCERARGGGHPCVAERLNDLADLYKREGRLDEAVPLLRRALEIQQHSFDPDSPMIYESLNKLSAIYADQELYDKAAGVYAEHYPAIKAKLGSQHPYLADLLQNWAMVERRANRDEQAEALLAEAKAIKIRTPSKIRYVNDTQSKDTTPSRSAEGAGKPYLVPDPPEG